MRSNKIFSQPQQNPFLNLSKLTVHLEHVTLCHFEIIDYRPSEIILLSWFPGNVKALLRINMRSCFSCVPHFESIPGNYDIRIGFLPEISFQVVKFLKNHSFYRVNSLLSTTFCKIAASVCWKNVYVNKICFLSYIV
jgi:hypothetical protein